MRILLFHINVFKQNSICDLCKDLGIDVSVASEADLSRTIGQIAGIQAAPGYSGKPGRPVPFHEEMMVFCGLDLLSEEFVILSGGSLLMRGLGERTADLEISAAVS